MSAYDLDLHAWAHAQADALRRRSANEVDWENVAEEIESLGRQTLAELTNRLEVLIVHLLKWSSQPTLQGSSWMFTIKDQRARIPRLVKKNPSLKAVQDEAFLEAYEDARRSASRETGLVEQTFPEAPPFTLDEVLDSHFWPGSMPLESQR